MVLCCCKQTTLGDVKTASTVSIKAEIADNSNKNRFCKKFRPVLSLITILFCNLFVTALTNAMNLLSATQLLTGADCYRNY